MLAEVIFALILAILFTFIFSWGCRPISRTSSFAFFVLLFLVILAGGLWLTPAGPVYFGIYWLPAFLLGLIFLLLIAGLIYPTRKPRNTEEAVEFAQTQRAVEISFNVFFWTLLIILIASILSSSMTYA